MKLKFILLIVVLLLPLPAQAWGEKGHYLSNEAATLGLPTDMPHFFLQSFPTLVWLGYEPDRWRSAGESLDAVGGPDHFLDYEYVAGLDLPRSRYEFLEVMEGSGRLDRYGIENSTSGFAPWRIAELSERLTIQFRRWRFTAAGSPERAMTEMEILHTAGVLGHYVADSANPHHATMHYNGWASAENPHRFAIDCGTHSRFESGFVSHAVDLEHVMARVAEPIRREDYFGTAMELLRGSNELVDDLYTLDRDRAFDPFNPAKGPGIAFASARLAAGASVLRDLWWSAWLNSSRSPRRRSDD